MQVQGQCGSSRECGCGEGSAGAERSAGAMDARVLSAARCGYIYIYMRAGALGVRVRQVYTGERIIRSSLSRIVARGPIGLIATLVRPRSEDLFAKRSSISGKSPDSAALVGLEGRWAVGHFSRFGAHLLLEAR